MGFGVEGGGMAEGASKLLNTISGEAALVADFAMCRSCHSEADKVEFKADKVAGMFEGYRSYRY